MTAGEVTLITTRDVVEEFGAKNVKFFGNVVDTPRFCARINGRYVEGMVHGTTLQRKLDAAPVVAAQVETPAPLPAGRPRSEYVNRRAAMAGSRH